jgi:hypothetical protein
MLKMMEVFMNKMIKITVCLLAVSGLMGCAFTMHITKATDQITAETTSMLIMDSDIDIIAFDDDSVQWTGLTSGWSRTGIIIPSGRHTLVGYCNGDSSNQLSISFDFQPKGFYDISGDTQAQVLVVVSGSESGEKKQMERDIALNQAALSSGNGTSNQPVTSQPVTRSAANNEGGIQSALNNAVQTVMAVLKKDENIAIISVSSSDKELSEYIAEELEVMLVNNKFIVVDRRSLDQIRQEQNFQLSGDVDDSSAVSIGKFVGAKIVIVGNISGSGSLRRLRLRALDSQSAQVVGAASEAF